MKQDKSPIEEIGSMFGMKYIIGAILGILLWNLMPVYSISSASIYCTKGTIFGCDWDKGMIIKDTLYITIPK